MAALSSRTAVWCHRGNSPFFMHFLCTVSYSKSLYGNQWVMGLQVHTYSYTTKVSLLYFSSHWTRIFSVFGIFKCLKNSLVLPNSIIMSQLQWNKRQHCTCQIDGTQRQRQIFTADRKYRWVISVISLTWGYYPFLPPIRPPLSCTAGPLKSSEPCPRPVENFISSPSQGGKY